MAKEKKQEKTADKAPLKGERIARYLARAGVASRREVERIILEGRITVDGQKLTHPAFLVTDAMRITLDGKSIAGKAPTRAWRYHKPKGLITTAKDPQGRPTVFDHLPPDLPRVVSVGRLDLNSEGLLLLTNDGALARYLEMPKHAFARHYRVRVFCGSKGIDPKKLAALAKGITIDGVHYKGIETAIEKPVTGKNADKSTQNVWLKLTLQEGKNREIRRVMEYLGWPVSRLIRIGYGPFALTRLAEGDAEEIPERVLRDHLLDYFKEQ